MVDRLDDRTPAQRRRQPSLQELAARRQSERGRFGRWGRLRSWRTTLVGVLALILLALWMALTR